jgi:hypothetical protein
MQANMKTKIILFIRIIFSLILITGTGNAQSDSLSEFNKLNDSPTRQPDQQSTLYNKIIQGYSAALKGNFFSSTTAEFKTSLFKIKTLCDSTNKIDSIFLKNYFDRNFDISIGLDSKSNQQITGITPGFKYAIINNRDRASVNFGSEMISEINQMIRALQKVIDSFKSEHPDTGVVSRALNSIHRFNASKNLNDLDPVLLPYIKDSDFYKHYTNLQSRVDSLANYVDRQPQWTIYTSEQFSQKAWDSVSVGTDFFYGPFPRTDFTLRFGIFTIHDSALKTSGLNKASWLISPGFDWVLLQSEKQNLLETNYFAEYTNIFKGQGKNSRNIYDFGFTLSPLIGTNLSLPVTIKYAPKGGNFYGFLELQWSIKPIPQNGS